MTKRRPRDKPLSESIMVSLVTHICVPRPQWVNRTYYPKDITPPPCSVTFLALLGCIDTNNISIIVSAWMNVTCAWKRAIFASDKLFVTVNGHMISSALYHCTNRNASTISLLYPRTTLLWRHNGHDVVSNHQPHGCLLNRLFRRRPKKTSKLRVTGLCVGNSPGPVNSPHEGPVTRKVFPSDDVIMIHLWRNILLLNDDGLFLIKWYPGAKAIGIVTSQHGNDFRNTGLWWGNLLVVCVLTIGQSLMLTSKRCWTSSQVDGDLRCNDAWVTSL